MSSSVADNRRRFITNSIRDIVVPYIDTKFSKIYSKCLVSSKSIKTKVHPLRMFQDYVAKTAPTWSGVDLKRDIEVKCSKGYLLDKMIKHKIMRDMEVYNIRVHNMIDNKDLRTELLLSIVKDVARKLYSDVKVVSGPRVERLRIISDIVEHKLDNIIPIDIFMRGTDAPVHSDDEDVKDSGAAYVKEDVKKNKDEEDVKKKNQDGICTEIDAGDDIVDSQMMWDLIEKEDINSYLEKA